MINSPEVENPTVESTSNEVVPTDTSPITLVLGWTVKLPYNAPSTRASLLYPPSILNL